MSNIRPKTQFTKQLSGVIVFNARSENGGVTSDIGMGVVVQFDGTQV